MSSSEKLQRLELDSLLSCIAKGNDELFAASEIVLSIRVGRHRHGDPERQGNLCPWRHSELHWAQPWATSPDVEVGSSVSRGWSGDSFQPWLLTSSGIYRGKFSVTVKLSFCRSVFIMKIRCFMNNGVSEHSLFRKSLSSNYTRS